jgi:glutamate-1-semialdehyde 2,1-aminomutase
MCAGVATLAEIESPGFYQELEEKTLLLTEPVKRAIQRRGIKAHLAQIGSMFSLFFGVTEVGSKEDLKDLDHPLFNRFFSYY